MGSGQNRLMGSRNINSKLQNEPRRYRKPARNFNQQYGLANVKSSKMVNRNIVMIILLWIQMSKVVLLIFKNNVYVNHIS